MSELADLLVSLRKRAGLSQSQVAERAQLSGGYLSQLESGARGDRIPRITLERLADALGADAKYLIAAAGYRIDNHNGIDPDRPRPKLERFVETEPTLNHRKSLYCSA